MMGKINQIMILWIMTWAFIYLLEIISGVVYIAGIFPVVLLYGWVLMHQADDVVAYSEDDDSFSDISTSHTVSDFVSDDVDIIIDQEFEEEVELNIGGEVRFDGWKEEKLPNDKVKIKDAGEGDGYGEAERIEK